MLYSKNPKLRGTPYFSADGVGPQPKQGLVAVKNIETILALIGEII